jgi:hypothetical protein
MAAAAWRRPHDGAAASLNAGNLCGYPVPLPIPHNCYTVSGADIRELCHGPLTPRRDCVGIVAHPWGAGVGAKFAGSFLIGGHIQMFFDLLQAGQPKITSRKVRPPMPAPRARHCWLTCRPLGSRGCLVWIPPPGSGWGAPAHAPAAITAKLIAGVEKVVKSPDIAACIAEPGSQPGTRLR